jgi:hypothetical protein
MQNFSLNGQTVLKLSGPKGVFLFNFFAKIQLDLLNIFDRISLHQMKELIFLGPHAKFQP